MSDYTNYFIKTGYIINQPQSFNTTDSENYWTQSRINTSDSYQYHVYKLAEKLIKQYGFEIGLDLGCGPATKTSKMLEPMLKKIYLIDQPSCRTLAMERVPNAIYHAINLEDFELQLPEEIDLIVCADVLEHLENPIPSLRFVYDNLSRGGLAIFSTPERDILRGKDCMQSTHPAHVREWNQTEFRQLIEFSGFKIERHVLLPPKRLSKIENVIWLVSSGMLPLKKWSSCQVVVCQK